MFPKKHQTGEIKLIKNHSSNSPKDPQSLEMTSMPHTPTLSKSKSIFDLKSEKKRYKFTEEYVQKSRNQPILPQSQSLKELSPVFEMPLVIKNNDKLL